MQLRELERDGLVGRRVYAQVPPKVAYSLTELGETLEPVLREPMRSGATFILQNAPDDPGQDKPSRARSRLKA